MKINELRDELGYIGMGINTDDLHDFIENREVGEVLNFSNWSVWCDFDKNAHLEAINSYDFKTHKPVKKIKISRDMFGLTSIIFIRFFALVFDDSAIDLKEFDIEIV